MQDFGGILGNRKNKESPNPVLIKDLNLLSGDSGDCVITGSKHSKRPLFQGFFASFLAPNQLRTITNKTALNAVITAHYWGDFGEVTVCRG